MPGSGGASGSRPWVARGLFVVLLMVLPGSQLLIYPVLWFLMPSDAVPEYHACRIRQIGRNADAVTRPRRRLQGITLGRDR